MCVCKCVYQPNTIHQGVHAFVHQVSVGLSAAEAQLFEEPGETEQLRARHLEVGVVEEHDLQQQRLLPQALPEPPAHLPVRLTQGR